jgi:hypothetical protein
LKNQKENKPKAASVSRTYYQQKYVQKPNISITSQISRSREISLNQNYKRRSRQKKMTMFSDVGVTSKFYSSKVSTSHRKYNSGASNSSNRGLKQIKLNLKSPSSMRTTFFTKRFKNLKRKYVPFRN